MMLTLCNKAREPIVPLLVQPDNLVQGEVTEARLQVEISGLSELSLLLPLYITIEGQREPNPRWQYIINERLVKYVDDNDNVHYFAIVSQEDVRNNQGVVTSNIQCKNISHQLGKKGLENYFEETGNATFLLGKALTNTGWSVGHVDEKFDTKVRSYKSENTSALEDIQAISELFSGFVKFDSNLKQVHLLESLGSDNGVSFRYKKNLKEISRISDSSEIITELYPYGATIDTGTVSIQDATENHSKNASILNFQYFIDNGELTNEQVQLIDDYKNDSLVVNENIQQALSDLTDAMTEKISAETELSIKQIYLDSYEQMIKGLKERRNIYETDSEGYDNLTNTISKYEGYVNNVENGNTFNAAGTVSVVDGDTEVIGNGTKFLTENLMRYDRITIDGVTRIINRIVDETTLYVTEPFNSDMSNKSMSVQTLSITALQNNIKTYYESIFNARNQLYGNRVIAPSGKVKVKNGENTVYGINTQFISDGIKQYDKITIGSNTKIIKRVLSETELETVDNYTSSLNNQLFSAIIIEDNPSECLGGYFKEKRDIESSFRTLLADFIYTGTFNDTSYINSDDLYEDALEILDRNAYPNVQYKMGILDLSKLSGWELEKINLGDTVYVYDELLGIDIKVVITKMQKDLLNYRNTTVEIANYSTSFQDLFREITKAKDTVLSSAQQWGIAKSAINNDGSINLEKLQQTLTQSNVTFSNTSGVTYGDNGIVVPSSRNTNELLRIDGGDILYSTDNGKTWNMLFSASSGLSIDNLIDNNLDISKINILGSTEFFWNDQGIFAKDPTNPTKKYIIFNKNGLKATQDGGITNMFELNADGSCILRDRVELPQAGMTNEGTTDDSVRIWAGSSYVNRNNAPFQVDQSGRVTSKNDDGNIVLDSEGLNPLEIAGFGIVRGLTFEVNNVSLQFQKITTVSSQANKDSTRLYLADVSGITNNNRIMVKYANGRTYKHSVELVGSNYVDLATSLHSDVDSGSPVQVVGTSGRNGSICDLVVRSGAATLPNGQYINLKSDYIFSSVDCMANTVDNDGYEFRILWLGSDGQLHLANVGTNGLTMEIYAGVYVNFGSKPDNPRTMNLGSNTNTPDTNAIILGYLLVGWGLGGNQPIVYMTPDYRDERPIKIETHVGDYDKNINTGSPASFGYSQITVNLTSEQHHLISRPLGYGIKCCFFTIQNIQSTNFPFSYVSHTKGGFVMAHLVDVNENANLGTAAMEFSSSPKLITEYYNDDKLGYILTSSALNSSYIKLNRAWLEVGFDKQTYLQLAFSTTNAETQTFRINWVGF